MNKKGEVMLEEMNMLWANHWMKLNGQWKDPESGRCYNRADAVRLLTSRARKNWIKSVCNQSSQALHSGTD